jgi:uncharacterized protein YndB with AHSA1/START domain
VRNTASDRVARTVILPTSAARVWRALVEPERLSAWLGGEVALEARAGGRVSMVDEKGEHRGMVEVVDAGRRLVFRLWAPPTPGGPLEGSRIEFLLEDLGASARLTVTEHRLGSEPTEPVTPNPAPTGFSATGSRGRAARV